MSSFDGTIDPAADWADVPLLSTEAVALGGADGALNAQAVALVKRTKHLDENKASLSDLMLVDGKANVAVATAEEAVTAAEAAQAAAAAFDPDNFATAEQGAKADTALQGADIGVSIQEHLASATGAEMVSGLEEGLRVMSPSLIAQAIAALAPSPKVPAVRQTVLSGPVDANGFAAFGGSTGSAIVTASGTLIVSAAKGVLNREGSITNPSWTGLSTNGTMYLYLDVAADGTCTPGSTALAPNYRWGGADVTTNGQNTFNIQEMTMKVGNGSSAAQVYRVFVGEVTVASNIVSAIVWYALMGRYDSGFTATFPSNSSSVSKNSNLGVYPDGKVAVFVECTSAEGGYSVGDRIGPLVQVGTPSTNTGDVSKLVCTRNTIGFSTGNSLFWLQKTGGTAFNVTLASWKWKIVADRGW